MVSRTSLGLRTNERLADPHGFCTTDGESLIVCFLRFVVTTSRRDSRQRGLQEEGGKLSVASFLWDFHRGIHDLPRGFKQPIKDLDVWLCHKSVAMKESVFAAYLLRVIKL